MAMVTTIIAIIFAPPVIQPSHAASILLAGIYETPEIPVTLVPAFLLAAAGLGFHASRRLKPYADSLHDCQQENSDDAEVRTPQHL